MTDVDDDEHEPMPCWLVEDVKIRCKVRGMYPENQVEGVSAVKIGSGGRSSCVVLEAGRRWEGEERVGRSCA